VRSAGYTLFYGIASHILLLKNLTTKAHRTEGSQAKKERKIAVVDYDNLLHHKELHHLRLFSFSSSFVRLRTSGPMRLRG
jgi:hypothetical protein